MSAPRTGDPYRGLASPGARMLLELGLSWEDISDSKRSETIL
jgi:hypothetical protein